MNNPTRVSFTLELEGVTLNCVGVILPREANQEPDNEQVLLDSQECVLEYPETGGVPFYWLTESDFAPWVEDCQLRKTPLGYIAFVLGGNYKSNPNHPPGTSWRH